LKWRRSASNCSSVNIAFNMASKRSLTFLGERLLTSLGPASKTSSRVQIRGTTRTVFLARSFHAAATLQKLQSVNLTDIGEGTTEAAIIQWKVKEGAAVKEWDSLCEVATDKAMTEVSRDS
jgi:hypothetical protein